MGVSDPSTARGLATEVARTLRGNGHVAYFAGGCVRDELLGLEPADYDIATDATPDVVSGLFARTAEVGAHFGVVLVHEGALTIEVATFRSDGAYSDRRRPDEVTFSDPESDAQRRDFTINALFLDPLSADEAGVRGRDIHGHVIDFVDGLGDLERGVIRAVGDPAQRLAEDHLRALRAIRFAARFGFRIDDATQEAIAEHARDLEGVSKERIGDELRRMMSGGETRAVAAWKLQFLGLDGPVLGTNVTEAPRTLGRLIGAAPLATCLAAWALDRREVTEISQIAGLVAAWRGNLCLSNDERDDLRAVLHGVATLERVWAELGVAEQKRAAASGWFDQALRIVSARDREQFVRVRKRVIQLSQTPSGLSPEPLVTGDDLIGLGLEPGPEFARLLNGIYDAQLEDRVQTREQALELARTMGV